MTIRQIEDEPFITIHLWMLALCENNQCAAALLCYFDYCHENKITASIEAKAYNDMLVANGKRPTQNEDLLQWHSYQEIEQRILLFKEDTIRKAIKLLTAKGCLEVHKNSNPANKFDQTTYYLFKPEALKPWLDAYKIDAKKRRELRENSRPQRRFLTDTRKNGDTYPTNLVSPTATHPKNRVDHPKSPVSVPEKSSKNGDNPLSENNLQPSYNSYSYNTTDNTQGEEKNIHVSHSLDPVILPSPEVKLSKLHSEIEEVFNYWKKVFDKRSNCLLAKGDKYWKAIEGRIKEGFTVADLKEAVQGCSVSPFHMGIGDDGQSTGKKFNCITLICRDKIKVDNFLTIYHEKISPTAVALAVPPKPIVNKYNRAAETQRNIDEVFAELREQLLPKQQGELS